MGVETVEEAGGFDRAVRTWELTKRFDGRLALQDVSFEADFGELIAVVGQNGAGKTTLLRALAGIVIPDHGRAMVCGFDTVRERSAVAARTGTMLESQHTWYPRLSGLTNLAFFATVAGLERRHATAAAKAALGRVGLKRHAAEPVSAYSRGMRARLAFARARIADPLVLLLDEPTASADRTWRQQLIGMLDAERGSRTVVLATHDEELLTALRPRRLELGTNHVLGVGLALVDAGMP